MWCGSDPVIFALMNTHDFLPAAFNGLTKASNPCRFFPTTGGAVYTGMKQTTAL